MSLLARVRRVLGRLEEKLPQVSVWVVVDLFAWRLDYGRGHLAKVEWRGEQWQADLTLGPIGVGVTLELPRRWLWLAASR